MLRFFKLVAVNCLVFLIVFFGLMFFVSFCGDVVKPFFKDGDKKGRHELIVFTDKEHAKQVFADGKKAVEGYAPIVGWRRLAMETQTVNISEEGVRVHQVGRDNQPGSPRIGFSAARPYGGRGSMMTATFRQPSMRSRTTSRSSTMAKPAGPAGKAWRSSSTSSTKEWRRTSWFSIPASTM